jgi:hypothetical protein
LSAEDGTLATHEPTPEHYVIAVIDRGEATQVREGAVGLSYYLRQLSGLPGDDAGSGARVGFSNADDDRAVAANRRNIEVRNLRAVPYAGEDVVVEDKYASLTASDGGVVTSFWIE